MIQFNGETYRCHMEVTIKIIGGKWKVFLLWHLGQKGVLRYGQLKKLYPGLTPKMLTSQLRELEEDKIVHREVFHQVPPKVEYSLTDQGKTLIPLLDHLSQWGEAFIK